MFYILEHVELKERECISKNYKKIANYQAFTECEAPKIFWQKALLCPYSTSRLMAKYYRAGPESPDLLPTHQGCSRKSKFIAHTLGLFQTVQIRCLDIRAVPGSKD